MSLRSAPRGADDGVMGLIEIATTHAGAFATLVAGLVAMVVVTLGAADDDRP